MQAPAGSERVVPGLRPAARERVWRHHRQAPRQRGGQRPPVQPRRECPADPSPGPRLPGVVLEAERLGVLEQGPLTTPCSSAALIALGTPASRWRSSAGLARQRPYAVAPQASVIASPSRRSLQADKPLTLRHVQPSFWARRAASDVDRTLWLDLRERVSAPWLAVCHVF